MAEQLLPVLWLIAVSVGTSVAGQTALKLGLRGASPANAFGPDVLAVLTVAARSPLVLLGLALYGVGALAWIVVLSRLDLSYAYPFVALNFVLVTVVSCLFLGEAVPALRWLGIATICVGLVLVARGSSS